jgi:predicted hydrocarbon binding protein
MQTEHQPDSILQNIPRQHFVIMSHSFMENMFTPLIRYLQNSGYPMIYSMGRESGIREAKQLQNERSALNAPLLKQEMLEKSLNRISQMGWGKITLTNYSFDNGGISIKIKFNPFTEECDSKINTSCTFLRGLISGITSEILEQDMQFSTPICQAIKEDTCLLNLSATMR